MNTLPRTLCILVAIPLIITATLTRGEEPLTLEEFRKAISCAKGGVPSLDGKFHQLICSNNDKYLKSMYKFIKDQKYGVGLMKEISRGLEKMFIDQQGHVPNELIIYRMERNDRNQLTDIRIIYGNAEFGSPPEEVEHLRIDTYINGDLQSKMIYDSAFKH